MVFRRFVKKKERVSPPPRGGRDKKDGIGNFYKKIRKFLYFVYISRGLYWYHKKARININIVCTEQALFEK
ncbi:MAG TPA: hypothetical protein DC013_03340 [Ruminococcaceae bacterium]|jgi:hypothetical protein|nr:hypothetical protein [Oscillospiraceae bacterium]